MPVVLNLDGNHPKCRVPKDTWRISVDSQGREDVEGYWDLSYAPGPLDWKQLAKLKKLTDLTYSGPDATVVEFVTSRGSKISTFAWHNSGRSRFDLSKAKTLQELGFDVVGKTLHLKLPANGRLRCLKLLSPPPRCRATVICPNRGEGLSLSISGGQWMAIPGLKRLSELNLFQAHEVDLALVARAYPHLKSLDIMGNPVTLSSERALARLKSLQRLSIHECYSMDVSALPDPDQLSALTSIEFDGLRIEDAPLLKAKYQSVDELSIYGKRSAEWIANHLENPFRNWADHFGSSVGNKAMAAWKKAGGAISKLGKRPAKAKARKILKDFVEVFNQIDKRTGLETDQREQIYEAFTQLAANLPAGTVTDDDYGQWAEYA